MTRKVIHLFREPPPEARDIAHMRRLAEANVRLRQWLFIAWAIAGAMASLAVILIAKEMLVWSDISGIAP